MPESTPPVLIFGASRGVGFALAALLRERGAPVRAMLRSDAGRGELEALGVRVARGDALDRADVAAAFAGLPAPAWVVSTLGGKAADGRRADDEGNITVIDAAVAARAQRLVLVTSMGCGEMAPYRSAAARAAFGDAVDAKTRAEDHLRRTGLAYTILRPGGLRSEPATGRGVLSADPEMHGYIHRADVALLVERVMRDPTTVGRAFAAVDADLARCANPLAPFPLAA